MARIEVQRDFPVSAETVWNWIGSTGEVASWIPAIRSSRMEGDVRHVVFTDGEPARERIVEFDDGERTYAYEYIDGPLPLRHYRSTVSVVETGDRGCTVRWAAEFGAESADVEAGLATAIEGIYSDALDELKGKVVPV
ncbi:SRPBCC family protein [Rhodococcus artemisiae]|uniref:SRPBCC family protein n=1 Tax=Rhodococcus artemisiae TaxID=714159 RepID=A0ABU7LJD1_9NOCA|nr:SRPBCC family protein [Rhodococcus artemisiae]MEE2061654.1 SRPBCC family protein [Rhodococcus artemisiae]